MQLASRANYFIIARKSNYTCGLRCWHALYLKLFSVYFETNCRACHKLNLKPTLSYISSVRVHLYRKSRKLIERGIRDAVSESSVYCWLDNSPRVLLLSWSDHGNIIQHFLLRSNIICNFRDYDYTRSWVWISLKLGKELILN